jgi:hypothetical protein
VLRVFLIQKITTSRASAPRIYSQLQKQKSDARDKKVLVRSEQVLSQFISGSTNQFIKSRSYIIYLILSVAANTMKYKEYRNCPTALFSAVLGVFFD